MATVFYLVKLFFYGNIFSNSKILYTYVEQIIKLVV